MVKNNICVFDATHLFISLLHFILEHVHQELLAMGYSLYDTKRYPKLSLPRASLNDLLPITIKIEIENFDKKSWRMTMAHVRSENKRY